MRRIADRLFGLGTGLAAGVACALLLAIAGFLLARGLPALSWRFLVTPTSDAGAGGGIVFQIAGSAILMLTAVAVAVPLALGLALVATVYLPPGAWRRRLALALYVVNGVPSIVHGVVGLVVFGRLLGWGKSWLAGGIVLGWMIVPTIAVAVMARIDAVPQRYLRAAAGLGLGPGQRVRAVILPHSAAGLVSGTLLGLARAAGETAPILFTAAVFSGAELPRAIRESPVLALPYHIFVLAQDALDPAAATRLWATAFVLLLLVTLCGLAAMPARRALHEEARRG